MYLHPMARYVTRGCEDASNICSASQAWRMMIKSLKAKLASREDGGRKLQTRGLSTDGRNPDGGCCIAAAKKTSTTTSSATPATSKKTQNNMVP